MLSEKVVTKARDMQKRYISELSPQCRNLSLQMLKLIKSYIGLVSNDLENDAKVKLMEHHLGSVVMRVWCKHLLQFVID